ncbi:MAG: glycosyltransferase family 39 protein [Deltaproteobacteria bacterium]|nr:glycosyltransferase family 39 protein [Deltaproteobacteria bacterium]
MSVSSRERVESNNPEGVSASPDSVRRLVSIAAAFIIALAILSLGITAPFEKDAESQSAQWVVDIAHHGNWLLPHDYYDLVERKPPLFYWLGGIGVKLSGGTVDEARARMPSLIAGAAVATLVMDWAAADLGVAAGWLAFFFLLGMYGFAARATIALTDMLMTFFLMAVWRMIRPQLDGASLLQRTACAGLILGLGILVKGPVIVVLIALAAFLYLLMGRVNPIPLAFRGWPWLLILIAIAVAAVWYVPAFIAGRNDSWSGVFVDENFGHFLPAKMGGTGEAARPIYYIVARLFGGILPLTFLLPALILAFASSAFSPNVRPAMRYQLAMVLAVILLFTASSAKRDDYILPAIPPLAILFAALFTQAIAVFEGHTSRARHVPIVRDITVAAIAAAMLLGVIVATVYAHAGVHPAELGAHLQSSDASFVTIFLAGLRRLSPRFVGFITGVGIGAIVIASALSRHSPIRSGAGLAVICIAGSTLWTGALKPQLLRTRTIGPFAAEVRTRVGAAPLYVAFMDPEFAWYYGSGVPAVSRQIAKSGPAPGTTIYIVSRPNELVRFSPAVRNALILVLPSSALGGNPPSLYLLGSVEGDERTPSTESPSPSIRNSFDSGPLIVEPSNNPRWRILPRNILQVRQRFRSVCLNGAVRSVKKSHRLH